MQNTDDSLALFHPLIAAWFRERVGVPTDAQGMAWPRIAAGEHVLVTAPTGSGKTLTAFLWALNQLITGEYQTGRCSVLYVSPLKALNNDIQRNLLAPLHELEEVFAEHEQPFPAIRVLTRSGDTPAEERRRMQRRPPEILITTPESLNLLLSSHGGIAMLSTLRAVILDEVHAVISAKRGTHLMTAVERLARLSGEFQRIALSATIRPLELVASFVGGYQRDGEEYHARPVALVRSAGCKAYQVQVHFPPEATEGSTESIWHPLVRECKEIIGRNRSTLLFTNTRRLAETITWKINADEEALLAYAHHGALSREIRAEVEHKMKAGQLKAIVATSSLEMGIDIGALDEVVLIQAPNSIASAIQRVGRAGHRVGEISRATLLPTHPQDLLASAVLARDIREQNIEAAKVVRCPLDVLAQVIISMTGVETWDIDALFAEIRCSDAFHNLTRAQYELVLNMLAGRYADTRIRELNARLSIDRLDNTVAARPGALQDLYLSGGMIPDRGYFHLRHQEGGGLIGELDEEFVWEASVGQMMTFGTQNWRIERITHNDVFVLPGSPTAKDAPFFRAEELDRDHHFSEQIALFLEEANVRLDDPDFLAELQAEHGLHRDAAEELLDYLHEQRESTGSDLPHRHHLVIEHVGSGPAGHPGSQVIIHTGWGGTVNRPFAMALAAAWDERFQQQLEIFPADEMICLLMTGDISGAELLSLVSSARLEELLRNKLEGSGFFGARFRECAGRALLITRRKFNERMPLWVSRLRSKKLLESVLNYPDFPILLEAWRTCLQDEFDVAALQTLLAECESGAIGWSEVYRETPSPFARSLSWRQINKYMYMDDTPDGRTSSKLRQDLLQEVVFSPGLRPALAPELVARFVAKRQRLAPGYAPQTSRDVLDWVKERLLIPLPEWRQLLAAAQRDEELDEAELLRGAAGKLAQLHPAAGKVPLIAAVESLPRLCPLWGDAVKVEGIEMGAGSPLPQGESRFPFRANLDLPLRQGTAGSQDDSADEPLTAILAEWLRFYGPLSPSFLAATLGLSPEQLAPSLEDLLDTQKLIQGALLRDGAEDDFCDSENFEILLRLTRAEAAPNFQPLPAEQLPLFLAQQQGCCTPGEDADDLWERLQRLSGYAARAELWEAEILPARMSRYDGAWLDSLMQEGDMHWLGVDKGKVSFCLDDDLPLLLPVRGDSAEDELRDLLPDAHARYTLQALAMKTSQRMQELVARLWDGVWRGVISNDSAAALRRGIVNDFQPPKLPEVDERRSRSRRVARAGLARWTGAAPFAGNWYRLPEPLPFEDALEEEERAKDRARLLLERYGLLFRELLQNELPALQWPSIFRALRLMELSGEVLAGCFFLGIPGLQFISPRAFRSLQRKLPERAVWWVNACDPIACSGLPLDAFRGRLPRRVPGNYLVYRGQQPVLFLLRGGKELQFFVRPGRPRPPALLRSTAPPAGTPLPTGDAPHRGNHQRRQRLPEPLPRRPRRQLRRGAGL